MQPRRLGKNWGQRFSEGFVWTVRNLDRFGGGWGWGWGTWSRGDDLGKVHSQGEDGGWRQEAPGSRSGRAGPMASLEDPQCVLASQGATETCRRRGTLARGGQLRGKALEEEGRLELVM